MKAFKFKTTILFLIALVTAGATAFGQVTETVNLTTAGTLKDYPFTNPTDNITDLTVTGTIDARDVQFMRDSMNLLANLDLSGATIAAYSGEEGTVYGLEQNYFVNEMPMSSFSKYDVDGMWFVSKDSLRLVILPSSLTSIGKMAFIDCRELTSVIFPDGLTYIGVGSFAYCSGLTGTLNLPSDLTYIGEGAFYNCSGLTSVIFPDGLTSIGEQAFQDCSGLTEITNLNPTPITIEASVFIRVDKSACFLKVPFGSVILYQNAAVWKEFLMDEVYTVSVTVNNSPYGLVSGGGNYYYNTQATLMATANPDYVFENWTSNGVVISTVNPFTFTVTKDTAIVANFVPNTGIIEVNSSDNVVVVYPNPVKEVLFMQLDNAGTVNIEEVKIHDIYGRLLRTESNIRLRKTEIDIVGLSAGIYFVSCKLTNGEAKTKRIVKE